MVFVVALTEREVTAYETIFFVRISASVAVLCATAGVASAEPRARPAAVAPTERPLVAARATPASAAATTMTPATERPTALAARAQTIAEQRWPSLPMHKRLTFGQRITDELTEFGNQLGYHLGVLSNDMLALSFDGRKRRAKVMVGTDDGGYLVFKLKSDVQFLGGGVARINAKVDLGIGGRVMHFDLPEFEMAPTEYRGERGVELRLPLIKQSF